METRNNPYIWVTWLTKLMTGECQCRWSSWFHSHYKIEEQPSDFDSASWKVMHTELLERRVNQLYKEGFDVSIENQNELRLKGKDDIEVCGKPDIIAIKEKRAYVEDCKTGKPRDSHIMQVMIYMMMLPHVNENIEGKILDGRVIYKENILEIPSRKIDDKQKRIFKELVWQIGGSDPPRKVPSKRECQYCKIPIEYCPEKIIPKDHGLF
jgi:CRISPR/Cas system-associated exonuclease Cas4 (RecB family)